jgi:hypothetical protein
VEKIELKTGTRRKVEQRTTAIDYDPEFEYYGKAAYG